MLVCVCVFRLFNEIESMTAGLVLKQLRNVRCLTFDVFCFYFSGLLAPMQGGIFVATRFLSRGTLSHTMGTAAPEGTTWIWRAYVRSWFPVEEALRQAAGVASALAYMHDRAVPVRLREVLRRRLPHASVRC